MNTQVIDDVALMDRPELAADLAEEVDIAGSIQAAAVQIKKSSRSRKTKGQTGRRPSRSAGGLTRAKLQQALEDALEALFGRDSKLLVLRANDPQVTQTIRDIVSQVPEVVREKRDRLTEENIAALVNVYLADDPLKDARRAIANDNAQLRARFFQEWPCLTSAEVADAAGHSAGNKSATAARWKSQLKIFSIPGPRGADLYPVFQFRDGKPHPAIHDVLTALPASFSPWQKAFWFVSNNGMLRGGIPANNLDESDQLIRAAERQSESLLG